MLLIVEGVIHQDEFIVLEHILRFVFTIFAFAAERWWKNGVNCNSYHILNEIGDDFHEHTSIHRYARIGVGLNQKRVQFLVKHIVKTEKLKRVLSPMRVEFVSDRVDKLSGYSLHFLKAVGKT